GEGVDRALDDAHLPPPFGPAIAIAYPRAAPTDADLAVAEAGFFLKVPPPDDAGVIVRGDFIPALQSEEPVIDAGRPFPLERITLHVIAASGERRHPLAAGGEG